MTKKGRFILQEQHEHIVCQNRNDVCTQITEAFDMMQEKHTITASYEEPDLPEHPLSRTQMP